MKIQPQNRKKLDKTSIASIIVSFQMMIGTIIFCCVAIAATNGSPRIIGGSKATLGQFPYFAQLQDDNGVFCGGSIINARWILTAAHCTSDSLASEIKIVVGTITTSGGMSYDLEKKVEHPSYNHISKFANDIALLRTKTRITFNSAVQPIALNTDPIGGGVVTVLSGFGATYRIIKSSDSLNYIKLTTISNEECGSFGYGILDSNICTSTVDDTFGICFGDSGGPLAMNGKLVGIVSGGKPCATGFPDIFTRVSSYIDWIMSQIGNPVLVFETTINV